MTRYRPYVYSVHAHDLAELQTAVRAAITTPIERYIPEHMRFDFVRDKVAELVEWDWQEEARLAKEEMRRDMNQAEAVYGEEQRSELGSAT